MALARESGSPAAEMHALTSLSVTAYYAENVQEALSWARLTQDLPTAGVPGWVIRMCHMILALMLSKAGELTVPGTVCAATGWPDPVKSGRPR